MMPTAPAISRRPTAAPCELVTLNGRSFAPLLSDRDQQSICRQPGHSSNEKDGKNDLPIQINGRFSIVISCARVSMRQRSTIHLHVT
jgi:hypothetical protein